MALANNMFPASFLAQLQQILQGNPRAASPGISAAPLGYLGSAPGMGGTVTPLPPAMPPEVVAKMQALPPHQQAAYLQNWQRSQAPSPFSGGGTVTPLPGADSLGAPLGGQPLGAPLGGQPSTGPSGPMPSDVMPPQPNATPYPMPTMGGAPFNPGPGWTPGQSPAPGSVQNTGASNPFMQQLMQRLGQAQQMSSAPQQSSALPSGNAMTQATNIPSAQPLSAPIGSWNAPIPQVPGAPQLSANRQAPYSMGSYGGYGRR